MQYTHLICYLNNLFDWDDWNDKGMIEQMMQTYIQIEGLNTFLAIKYEILFLRKSNDYSSILNTNTAISQRSFDKIIDCLLKKITEISNKTSYLQTKALLAFIEERSESFHPERFKTITQCYINKYEFIVAYALYVELNDANHGDIINLLSPTQRNLVSKERLAEYKVFLAEYLPFYDIVQPFPKLKFSLILIASMDTLIQSIEQDQQNGKKDAYLWAFGQYIKHKGLHEYLFLIKEVSKYENFDKATLEALSVLSGLSIKIISGIVNFLQNDSTLVSNVTSYPHVFSYLYNYITLNYNQLDNGPSLLVKAYFDNDGINYIDNLLEEIAILDDIQGWEIFIKHPVLMISMDQIKSVINTLKISIVT